MRTPHTLFALGMFLTCVTPVRAQSPGSVEPGDAGIFADPQGTVSTMRIEPFVAFDVYVVAFDLEGGLRGYEFNVSGHQPLLILGTWQVGRGSECFSPDCNYEFIGVLPCLAEPGPVVLAKVTFFASSHEPVDQALCLRQTVPTSFPLEPGDVLGPGLPGYMRCDRQLQPFGVAQNGGGVYPDGCLLVNPTIEDAVVPIDAASFGEVKARF